MRVSYSALLPIFESTRHASHMHLVPRRGVLSAIAVCFIASGFFQSAFAQISTAANSSQDARDARDLTFADEGSRHLLNRARTARRAQDSTLRYYSALTNLRVKYAAGIRTQNAERLLMLSEQSAKVTWSRQNGVAVERTGVRNAPAVVSADLIAVTPIPYWPEREAVWMPVTTAIQTRDLNEAGVKHPLAEGAEQFYRFASGDSIMIRLVSGREIRIRELRVTPRRPDWHMLSGSFWFEDNGNLVRAAYRLAGDIDIWQLDKETQQAVRKVQQSIVTRATNALVTSVVKGSMQPLSMQLGAVTIEYSLHDNRIWLPRLQNADGVIRAGAFRIPITWDERFQYDSVSTSLAETPTASAMAQNSQEPLFDASGPASLAAFRSKAASDSVFVEYQARAAHLRSRADTAIARGDSIAAHMLRTDANKNASFALQALRQRDECAASRTYAAGTIVKDKGAYTMAVRLPCDPAMVESTSDFPDSRQKDTLFKSPARDQLLRALDNSAKPGWISQPPELLTGLSLLRYNRIEALSVGAAFNATPGRGLMAKLETRYGFGDRVPNVLFSLSRSRGNTLHTLSAYRRLSVANDLAGAPLSFGASISNLLLAQDEGFYFRQNIRLTNFRRATHGNFAIRDSNHRQRRRAQSIRTRSARRHFDNRVEQVPDITDNGSWNIHGRTTGATFVFRRRITDDSRTTIIIRRFWTNRRCLLARSLRAGPITIATDPPGSLLRCWTGRQSG